MNVACMRCNWVSFALTKKEADAEIQRFLDYYDSLSPEDQKSNWSGKREGFHYKCIRCLGTEFRPANEHDLRNICGKTINPVIYES